MKPILVIPGVLALLTAVEFLWGWVAFGVALFCANLSFLLYALKTAPFEENQPSSRDEDAAARRLKEAHRVGQRSD